MERIKRYEIYLIFGTVESFTTESFVYTDNFNCVTIPRYLKDTFSIENVLLGLRCKTRTPFLPDKNKIYCYENFPDN